MANSQTKYKFVAEESKVAYIMSPTAALFDRAKRDTVSEMDNGDRYGSW